MLTLFRDPNGSDAFGWDVGGAESNVARYCAALGMNSAWISQLGSGVAGSLVHDVIAADGVDTSLVGFREDVPTGLMLRESSGRAPSVQYYRRGSAASQMSPLSFPLEACLDSRIVHMTGITLALSGGCRNLVHSVLSRPVRMPFGLSMSTGDLPCGRRGHHETCSPRSPTWPTLSLSDSTKHGQSGA